MTSGLDRELFNAARDLFLSETPEKALPIIQQALRNYSPNEDDSGPPTVGDGYILLARILRELRRFDDCRECLRKAIEAGYIGRDDPKAAVTLLWLEIAKGSYTEVIDTELQS